MVLDDNREPTAADHGEVLYEIGEFLVKYDAIKQSITFNCFYDFFNWVPMYSGKSDTIGRYMVASRSITPDEVIFTDQPAVIGPDNAAVPMCLVCWRYECKI